EEYRQRSTNPDRTAIEADNTSVELSSSSFPKLTGLDLLCKDVASGKCSLIDESEEEDSEVTEKEALPSPPDLVRREALLKIRLDEYAQSLFLRATDTLPPREMVALELYFFDGLTIEDLASFFDRSSAEVDSALDKILEKVSLHLTREDLYTPGESRGLEIERYDLKLEEPHGITLLSHWVDAHPLLSKDPRLLSLCIQSEEEFAGFVNTERARLQEFLSAFFSKGSPFPVPALSQPARQLFASFVSERIPSLQEPSYDREIALLLGLPAEGTDRSDTRLSSKRYYSLVKELIGAGVVSGDISPNAPLTVSNGGLSIRNPLLVKDVVGPSLAHSNREKALRCRFPNLDLVNKDMPHYNAVCGLVGVKRNSTVETLRKRFLDLELLDTSLPDDYIPNNAASAYFSALYLTEEEIVANQDELIRRKWGNLDDVEEDALVASVCGIANRLEPLVKRAQKVLGSTPPDRHPLNYLPRESTRYGSSRFIEDPELRRENIKKLIGDSVGSLSRLTHENLKQVGGSKRIAVLAEAENNLLDIAKRCVAGEYLSPLRPQETPLHLPNGKIHYFYHADVVGIEQALKNLAALLLEIKEAEGEIEASSGLLNAFRLSSGGVLRPVLKGHTFSRAVDEVLRVGLRPDQKASEAL
ncbi:MAG: hypothetical protein KDD64_01865, partial [Bdellovibrionales bacterium]|nr:hypothetical protein [Bdellovibrionales bacterium]